MIGSWEGFHSLLTRHSPLPPLKIKGLQWWSCCIYGIIVLFFINFCNLNELYTNFQIADYYLFISKRHLFFLNETENHMFRCVDSPTLLPLNASIFSFQAKVFGVPVFKMILIVCVSDLESSEFYTLWVKISCQFTIKFTCLVYLSPDSSKWLS